MSDKKTILILIAIVSVVIILIAIIIGIYKTPAKTVENNPTPQSNLYFVTQNADKTLYGISTTEGKVILEPKYTQMARINDSVYLKNNDDSYIFFLNDGTSISLGGKEAQIYFVYDNTDNLLPYYILRYGDTEQSSIYRIYNDKGTRQDSRDFASLNDAYQFLNAKVVFKANVATADFLSKYNVISTISYPTKDGKTQYIVTKKTDLVGGLEGVVDETGRVILDLTYTKITQIPNSTNALDVVSSDKEYVFLSSEKLVEVEPGFEFVTADNYFIQKKGNTVNKIYNSNGEVVVDGIYNLNEDLVPLTTKSGTTYMLVQDKKGVYSLYNLTNNKKNDTQYTNVVLDYIDNYTNLTKNTSFMYSNNGTYYALDLSNLYSYKLNVLTYIYSPLDMGIIYGSK